jgi:hypothetical protein
VKPWHEVVFAAEVATRHPPTPHTHTTHNTQHTTHNTQHTTHNTRNLHSCRGCLTSWLRVSMELQHGHSVQFCFWDGPFPAQPADCGLLWPPVALHDSHPIPSALPASARSGSDGGHRLLVSCRRAGGILKCRKRCQLPAASRQGVLLRVYLKQGPLPLLDKAQNTPHAHTPPRSTLQRVRPHQPWP